MQFTKIALAALSLGSAIAAPTKRASPLDALNSVIAQVGQAQTIIETEVQSVTSLLGGGNVDITKVESSLLNIGSTATGVLNNVLSLSQITGLAGGDLDAVPKLLASTKTIVSEVQSLGGSVTNGLPQEVVGEVNSALAFALSTVGTVSKPLISFVEAAVPQSAPVFNEVNGLVGELTGVANGLLGPVNGILGGLGLGL